MNTTDRRDLGIVFVVHDKKGVATEAAYTREVASILAATLQGTVKVLNIWTEKELEPPTWRADDNNIRWTGQD